MPCSDLETLHDGTPRFELRHVSLLDTTDASNMRQGTLTLTTNNINSSDSKGKKRERTGDARPSPAGKKIRSAAVAAGTSSQPIDLDAPPEAITIQDDDVDDDDNAENAEKAHASSVSISELDALACATEPVAGPSTAVVPRHDGPTTAQPLRINPPSFDVAAIFTHAEPSVILKNPDLDLLYFKGMIRGRQLYDYLLNELPWYRVTYQTRGITIRTPRWTTVFGKDDSPTPATDTKVYKIAPRKIPEALEVLLEHMQERTGKRYNFVLVNLYENGKDSISWHSDDESFLGPLPCIASLSLGSSRDFQMKHKTEKVPVEKWALQSGDCVVMRGTTQSKWLHSVPKRANAGPRMNLTFRRAMNTGGTNNYYRYNVYTGDVHRWRGGQMVPVK